MALDLTSTDLTPANGFSLIEARYIESLNVRLEHYIHTKTNAHHYHIAANNEENVFMVSLKTMPQNSTGVAHILEHTALCGSKKYPVRDPFFMMIRRSLNTFMNAMTSSDWTAYPFATENHKDYENLLNVYLDAVFFSRLDELDFLQEGHRVEFSQIDDPSSPLVYKGVVFNEMKGAMSSPVSTLYQTMKRYLFPFNTYHFNSGGDPEHIPDLSYAQLKEFYKTHYHPSNANFFTFGNRPAHDIQERLERLALHSFEPLQHSLQVPLEKRFSRRLSVEESYPYEGDTHAKTYITLGWLLNESTNLLSNLEAHLISDLLLDNSASPLKQALETCNLGTTVSPLCGLDDSNREMLFMCGIEGSEPEQAQAFEDLVWSTLDSVIQQGIPKENIEAVLHQLELSQREITGDGYPYGLQLIFSVTGAATHQGDVLASLDIDTALAQLRKNCEDPNYIGQLIKRLLIDNVHSVRMVMKPDTQMKARQQQLEQEKLATLQNALRPEEQQHIIQQAQALIKRQQQQDNEDVLPKVTLDDVKPDVKRIHPSKTGAITLYNAGTNGLAYQQWYWALPELTPEEKQYLPLYCQLLTELGCGDADYLQMQQRQASVTGGLNLFTLWRPPIEQTDQLAGYLVFSGKALVRNFQKMTQLITDHWYKARFDEHERITDHLTLISSRQQQSITGNGHGLAMAAASAYHSNTSAFHFENTGLPALKRLKTLTTTLHSKTSELEHFSQALQSLHQKLLQQPVHALTIAEQDELASLERHLSEHNRFEQTLTSVLQTQATFPEQHQVWSIETQVNFCAMAYKTVPPSHPDSAALTVLAGILRNNYLHTKVREQGGAYGGGASHDSTNGVFRFYSYRDPRLMETIGDFEQSIEWLMKADFDKNHIEQSILGVISSLDKPGSPAGEAKQAFQNTLFGRSDEFRKAYREQLLSVNKAQLLELAEKYFTSSSSAQAIITDKNKAETLQQQSGFTWHNMND